MEIQ
jgi:hypothetical protein